MPRKRLPRPPLPEYTEEMRRRAIIAIETANQEDDRETAWRDYVETTFKHFMQRVASREGPIVRDKPVSSEK